jgi:predicted DNA-binding protein (MmcQ/YjbR family)
MNVEELCAYCLNKKAAEDTFPFGETTMVFKVMGKIFAILPLDVEETNIALKCDPDRAIELRETHPDEIIPGFHLNKQHWNTVYTETGLSSKTIQELIDHSYELIVKSLPKKIQAELENLT